MKTKSLSISIALLSLSMTLLAVPVGSQTTGGADQQTLNSILHDNVAKRPTDATVARIQSIIDKNPQDFYARLVMGNTLDRLGLPMQAIEQYQLAVKLGPNSPKAVIELVKAQIGVGQKEAAMRLLQEAAKRFPDDKEILFWMGNYYLTKGDTTKAEEYFNKVGSSNNQFFGMSTARAEIKLKAGHNGAAILLAENDLMRDPTYPLANAVKGLALFNMRRFHQAESSLRVAFATFPLQGDYARKYAESCYMTGDFQQALEPAMVALAVASKTGFPDDEVKWVVVNVIKKLPYSLVRAQAPQFLEKIDKFVNSTYSHFAFGDIFDAAGYHDLATKQFYQAFKLDPSSATTAFRLANNLELYFQQYNEAIYYLTQAHSLNPDNTEITDRLDRLQNRLPGRSADLAWQLKDMIWAQRSPIEH